MGRKRMNRKRKRPTQSGAKRSKEDTRIKRRKCAKQAKVAKPMTRPPKAKEVDLMDELMADIVTNEKDRGRGDVEATPQRSGRSLFDSLNNLPKLDADMDAVLSSTVSDAYDRL